MPTLSTDQLREWLGSPERPARIETVRRWLRAHRVAWTEGPRGPVTTERAVEVALGVEAGETRAEEEFEP